MRKITRNKIVFFIGICCIFRSYGVVLNEHYHTEWDDIWKNSSIRSFTLDDDWKYISMMIFDESFFNKKNIEFILQKHTLSIEKLYQILQDKKKQADINVEKIKNEMSYPELLLNNLKNIFDIGTLKISPPSIGFEGRELTASFYRNLYNSLKSWIIGIPTFFLGITRYFRTKSSSANTINIGLILAGGLLSAPLNIAFLFARINGKFPKTAEKIRFIYFETFVSKKINQTMNRLKEMYPELSQQ